MKRDQGRKFHLTNREEKNIILGDRQEGENVKNQGVGLRDLNLILGLI